MSTLFLSYESVLIHAMAFDHGLIREEDTVSPCRAIPFPRKPKGVSDTHRRIGEFSSALTHLLVKTKLEDDVLDDRSWVARLANRLLRKKFGRAVRYFKTLDPDFESTLGVYLKEHRIMELGRSATSLSEYTLPTSNAFGYVFSLFGKALNEPELGEVYESIGKQVGKAIIFADCGYDWAHDMKKGLYNPVQTLDESAHAIAASQTVLREGALIANRTLGDQCVTEQIFLGVHDRLYRATQHDKRYQPYLIPLQECASLGNAEKKQGGIIMAANAACPTLALFAQADPPAAEPWMLWAGGCCACIGLCYLQEKCRHNCSCCDETCKCCGDCSDGCGEASKKPVGNDTAVQDVCFNCCDGCNNASDRASARRAREHFEKTGKDIGGCC